MKHFTAYIALLSLIAIFCGCAHPRQIMVDPKTWQQNVCYANGFGLGGVPAAYLMYNKCLSSHRAMGMIPLEEAEAKDASKLDMVLDASGKQTYLPEWKVGYIWEYTPSIGEKRTFTVQNIGTHLNADGYNVLRSDGKSIFYNKSLAMMTIFGVGSIDVNYSPPWTFFDFPLFVGKSWASTTEMSRTSGTMKVSSHYEVMSYGKVKVPAGEFLAFYIMGKTSDGARLEELWYSPEVRNYVKGIFYSSRGMEIEELSGFRLNND